MQVSTLQAFRKSGSARSAAAAAVLLLRCKQQCAAEAVARLGRGSGRPDAAVVDKK